MYLLELVFLFFPWVELLCHRVVLFLVFGETSILSSTVATPIYIPTNSVQGFPFFIPLPIFVICGLFEIDILMGERWCLTMVLSCISLIISDTEHLFMCLLAVCIYPLEKYPFSSSAHFLIRLFVFLMLSCMICLYMLNINPLLVFSSVQFSHSVVSNSLWPHGQQHTKSPCPSPTPGVYSNSCPSSRWCHPTISSSVIPFSSHLQSFPASESFPMSQFFPSGGQSIGVSASASVLPMNIQDWFPLGWTGWISLQFKGLSRVFSNTTVQKHQFFDTQLFL